MYSGITSAVTSRPTLKVPRLKRRGLNEIKTAKLILPALTEATSPYWRPIKYSLFPPLGLATLAAYLDEKTEITLVDEHVEPSASTDEPVVPTHLSIRDFFPD
jgi:hypothetical protein